MATTGHVGAAAAASIGLGLGIEQATAAVGIATTMAGGSMEFLTDGAWTKSLHPGITARNGLESAVLASKGFRGPYDGMGGPSGFLEMFTDGPRHPLLEDWGVRPLEIRNTSIKAHACCRYNQPAIDAII